MLKNAIKAKNKDIKCPNRVMWLFLARKDGEWLKEKDLIEMRKGEISSEDESCYMKEELEGVTAKIYEKLPNTIPDGIIHVLVAVPTKDGAFEDDSFSIYALATSRLLEFTFLNVSSTTPSRAQTMKKKLVKAYKCDCEEENENGESMLLCMVMDISLPSSVVIASHIFRRERASLKDWIVGIKDIDDMRNGLLLFKPIKSAMDNLDIVILVGRKDQFTLAIFNPTIRAELLVDWLTEEQWKALGGEDLEDLPTDWRNSERPLYAPNAPDFDILTTFGELDAKTLQFPRGVTTSACLYFQAQFAREKAITEGWMPKEYNFDDFSSEGLALEEKMELLFRSVA